MLYITFTHILHMIYTYIHMKLALPGTRYWPRVGGAVPASGPCTSTTTRRIYWRRGISIATNYTILSTNLLLV